MVLVGYRRKEKRKEPKTKFTMATGAERTRNLHNFLLPRSWGCQKQLRCVKLEESDAGVGRSDHSPAVDRSSLPSSSKLYLDHNSSLLSCNPSEREQKRSSFLESENIQSPLGFRQSPSEIGRTFVMNSDQSEGIEQSSKNVMLDLRTEMDKMKFNDLRKGKEEFDPSHRLLLPPRVDKDDGSAVETKPWNLRKRRAVCKEPNGSAGERPNFKLSMAAGDEPVGVKYIDEKRQRDEFSVTLSKQEIQEDFIAIIGRPPKKPKKRPSRAQRKMDALFPGSLISEIRADMYIVNENHKG